MRLDDFDKIFLLGARDLQLGPCRKDCHSHHSLRIRAEPLELTYCRILRIICRILEVRIFLMFIDDSPVKVSNAVIRSLRIRPMRSISVTSPADMNVAQTSTAADAKSGDESAAKAGVRAELI